MNRVTILIPAFNRGYLITETINSCFKQTFTDFSIIIYDDGSTDDTEDVVRKLIKKHSRISYIKSDVNMGIGHARQVLLNNLKTEYGVWLDSDDLMDSRRLEKCVEYMDSNTDVDILYSNIEKFTNNKSNGVIEIDISKYTKEDFKSLKNNTACATAFFRNKIKEFTFESEMRHSAEDVLWLWKLLCNNVKIGHIPELLYLYRWHADRTGIKKRLLPEEEYIKEQNILIAKIKEYQNNG